MQRLFLLAVALVLSTAPAFAQSADLATPGSKPADAPAVGVSVPLGNTNSLALLYDNGPIQTGTGNGAGGANTSSIGASYGSTTFGFQHNPAAAQTFRVADDFTVPAGGWTISDMQFFAYQTGGSATASSFTNLYVRIWNGRPGDAGSTVVFGDTTTSRLASSTFTGIYRVETATLTGSTRPIYRNTASINTFLAPGTYWVEWATTGTIASGPWAVPVTGTGTTPPPGNARQRAAGVWQDILDGGTATTTGTIPTDLAFVVNGTAGTVTGPALSALPGSIAFGTVIAGQTSAPRTVTLTNNGTAAVTITSITASGAPFAVNTTGTSFTLAPNATTTFTVTFSPTSGASSTGSVSIVSNAPGSPLSIALTGTGNADVTTTVPAGTTVGAPTWARATGATCATATTTTGNATAYVTRPFTVATAGNYTLTTQYPTGFDGYLILYSAPFDPAAPCTNRVNFSDDAVIGGGTAAQGSQIVNQALTAGNYVLVITGYNNAAAGSFTGTVVGPAAVTFQTTAGEGAASNGRASLVASPNPVRGAARVRFVSATAQDVTVAVYDVTGRQVATLFQGAVAADQAVDARLDAASLPSGVYVVRATGTDLNLTQRVTVVR